MWLLTVELHEGTHYHVDIGDPAQAAAIVARLNEASNGTFYCRLVFLDGNWKCDRAGCPESRSTQESAGEFSGYS